MVKYVDYQKIDRNKITKLREKLAEAAASGNKILGSISTLPPANQPNPTIIFIGEKAVAKIEAAIKEYDTKVSEAIEQAKEVHRNFQGALTALGSGKR